MGSFYGKKHKRSALLFYCMLLAFPVLQFCIFYIGVNFKSILMAFSEYSYDTGKFNVIGFDNFIAIFKMFGTQDELLIALKNSGIVYLVTVFVGMSLGLVFSYYIFRKLVGYKFFKIMLFLPSILSVMSLAVIYEIIVERVLRELLKMDLGLLSNQNTMFWAVMVFTIFVSFGTSVLMYVGAMNNISESVLESARLDGASPLREFISIVLPMIYPTFVTFLVVNTAGIFTNQFNLYSFYGPNASFSVQTIGYYLYNQTHKAQMQYGAYPQLAAFGMLGTFIAVPLTLGLRHLLEKIGPSTEK